MAKPLLGSRFMRGQEQHQQALGEWLTADTAKAFSRHDMNWVGIIHAAADAGVLPSLYLNSAKPPLSSQLPEEIKDLLFTVHQLNTDRNRTALDQAQQVASALNLLGVQPVALKGLANILAGIYPDVGARYLADIDLLVPAVQFPAAVAAFQSLGYTTDPAHPVEFNIGHSYPPLTRPNSLEVDLHRTMGLGICVSFLPASETIAHSTVHQIGGASIRLPSPEHLVIHHIMHSQMHDHYRERINPSLRTLYDFFRLERHFRETLDWLSIEDHFRHAGQRATLALYLLQVQCSLGIKPPVALRLSSALRLRRRRRELLQKHPPLRFLDPSYYYLAGLMPRTRRLREILSQPGGLQYLLLKFRRPGFYARLRHDFG